MRLRTSAASAGQFRKDRRCLTFERGAAGKIAGRRERLDQREDLAEYGAQEANRRDSIDMLVEYGARLRL